jgi:organic radical activating enzyme
MSKYYCALPFLHHEVKTTGWVAPCCVSRTVYKDENGVPYNVATTDINDILNSKDATQMRHNALTEQPVRGCEECYVEEENGNVTRRMRENRKYKNKNIFHTTTDYTHRYIDLKLGNLCNLACRICSPLSSSRWVDDYRQAGIKDPYEHHENIDFKWYESDLYWKRLENELPYIDQIDLYGGEPFLIKQQFAFLEKIIEKGYSKNITLNYATNGTVYPRRAITDIWPHFKKLTLLFSADGMNETFEYARYPAKWSVFDTNLKHFVNDHQIYPYISYSISNYSAFDLMNSFEYYYNEFDGKVQLWLNLVYDSGSNVACMPQPIKDKLLSDIARKWRPEYESIIHEKTWGGILNHINADGDPKEWELFKRNVNRFDAVRNQNIVNIIPEYKGYI